MKNRRASDNFPTALSSVEPLNLSGIDYCNCRQFVVCHNPVSLFDRLAADINREPHKISVLQTHPIVLMQLMVSVGETTLSFIGHNELAKHHVGDFAILMRQIPSNIVAPELSLRQFLNLFTELIPGRAKVPNLAPPHTSGTILGIAALVVERAGRRAGFPLSVGDWDRACLGVSAGGNEPDEHRLVATERIIGSNRGDWQAPTD